MIGTQAGKRASRAGFIRWLQAATVLLALSAPASAQDYPRRPVRLVVPASPGGSFDVLARDSVANMDGERA